MNPTQAKALIEANTPLINQADKVQTHLHVIYLIVGLIGLLSHSVSAAGLLALLAIHKMITLAQIGLQIRINERYFTEDKEKAEKNILSALLPYFEWVILLAFVGTLAESVL